MEGRYGGIPPADRGRSGHSMSLFVLDTDTLTLLQRRLPIVCERAAAHASETAITVLTVEEQLSGWYALLRKARNPIRSFELIEAWLKTCVSCPSYESWIMMSRHSVATKTSSGRN